MSRLAWIALNDNLKRAIKRLEDARAEVQAALEFKDKADKKLGCSHDVYHHYDTVNGQPFRGCILCDNEYIDKLTKGDK